MFKINSTIGEVIRRMESDYIRGNVQISKYVKIDMYDTINIIEAYLNSKHITGEKDALGRDKPFPNICIAASNIWDRATDIDRKNIKIKAAKNKDIIDAFLATIFIRNWMIKSKFGLYLNNWGKTLSRYGSAVTKFVKNSEGLNIMVIPWNKLICDPIDFKNNPKIEVLELTESQLRKKKGYDKEMIKELIDTKKSRETLDRRRKDNKADYIKVYELHGEFALSEITGKEKDQDYVQQMHAVSFLSGKNKGEYDDFTLYKGKESKDPYEIAHLIEEDGRTLSIGAVEHLFQAQWMTCHNAKNIKDILDFTAKIFFQTSDGTFVGKNLLTSLETGDITIHAINQPLTQVNNQHDTSQHLNSAAMWKNLGNEITGISEAMLGASPKSGTAWRQTEALLQESYNLFEKMIENKGLYLEYYFREHILDYIKTKMDTAEEVAAILELYEIDWVDKKYIKNFAIKRTNEILKEKVLSGEDIMPGEQEALTQGFENEVSGRLKEMGNQRFFKPDKVNWKKQFENLEWEIDIDITGENKDYQGALATLNTALQVIVAPGFEQNQRAQLVVDKILSATGHLSPLELSQIRQTPAVPISDGSNAGLEIKQPIQ